MAAIVSVTNGITEEDEQHFNQYADAFSNVLGITDTTQDRVGRLALPQGGAFPGAPVQAQLFWRTNQGSAGRLNVRDGAGNWVPFMPVRQIHAESLGGDIALSGSASNIITEVFTTTGGWIMVMGTLLVRYNFSSSGGATGGPNQNTTSLNSDQSGGASNSSTSFEIPDNPHDHEMFHTHSLNNHGHLMQNHTHGISLGGSQIVMAIGRVGDENYFSDDFFYTGPGGSMDKQVTGFHLMHPAAGSYVIYLQGYGSGGTSRAAIAHRTRLSIIEFGD